MMKLSLITVFGVFSAENTTEVATTTSGWMTTTGDDSTTTGDDTTTTRGDDTTTRGDDTTTTRGDDTTTTRGDDTTTTHGDDTTTTRGDDTTTTRGDDTTTTRGKDTTTTRGDDTTTAVKTTTAGKKTTTAAKKTTGTRPDIIHHMKEIGFGIFKGLLSDTDDVTTCESDGMAIGLNLAAAVQELEDHKVSDALDSVKAALNATHPFAADCKELKGELQTLSIALRHMTPKTLEQHIKAHKEEINAATHAAGESEKKGDFDAMGMNLGKALRLAIEEEGILV